MSYYEENSGSFLGSIPSVTKNILIVNIIMFIATYVNFEYMLGQFALFFPASPYFRPWQIVTHMFMHGGFWHLFFNMYALWMFGSVLERTIGSKKFLMFYFVAGFGAVLMHMGVEWGKIIAFDVAAHPENTQAYWNILRTPTVGASGAIYGILIGYAMMYPDSVLMLVFPPVQLRAKWLVAIFVVIELMTGVFGTMDGIAHFAHLGGMLFGWLLLFAWKKTGNLYRRDDLW